MHVCGYSGAGWANARTFTGLGAPDLHLEKVGFCRPGQADAGGRRVGWSWIRGYLGKGKGGPGSGLGLEGGWDQPGQCKLDPNSQALA